MTPNLSLEAVCMRFGGLSVLDGVSLRLAPGERRAVIGPNGAGKTTLVNVVAGALRPHSGAIRFMGRDVGALPTHRRARLGLVRTFQISSLFPSFSALENVALAVAERERVGLSWRTRRGFPSFVADEAEALGRRIGVTLSPAPVSALAYGQQRLVEFAIALAQRPRVLLLDEPAAGLGPGEHALVLDAIAQLPAEASVLLIEHDMELVFRFADVVTVLAEGRVVAEGAPADIAGDATVRAIYLGTRA